jgi:hypothetical protein
MVVEGKEEPIKEKRIEPWTSHYWKKKGAIRSFGDIEVIDPKIQALIMRIHRRGKSKSALKHLLTRHAREMLS